MISTASLSRSAPVPSINGPLMSASEGIDVTAGGGAVDVGTAVGAAGITHATSEIASAPINVALNFMAHSPQISQRLAQMPRRELRFADAERFALGWLTGCDRDCQLQ